MLDCWRSYVDKFRYLIRTGCIITKRKDSTLYTWVYPKSKVPHKLRMKDAYETLAYADNSASIFGTTTSNFIHYCLHDCPVR